MQFKLGNILEGRLNIFMVILIVILIFFALFVPGLTANQDFDDYLPRGDDELLFYQDFSSRMGSDDDIMMISVTSENGIFNRSFLTRVDSFANELYTLKHISQVISLTNLKRHVYMPGSGVLKIPLINMDREDLYLKDSIRIMNDGRLKNWIISSDANTLILLLFLEQGIYLKDAEALMTELDSVAASYNFDDYHKAGKIFWEVTYTSLSHKELIRGFIIGIILISLFILLLYRSWRILLLSLLIYISSCIMLFGYMSFRGREMNAIDNIIPVILIIVSISDIIHILEKYRNNKYYVDRQKRITTTLNEVGLSVFLTSLTTSIGFMTLTLSSVTSLKNLGIDMALGIIFTFCIAVILIPFFIKIFKIDLIYSSSTFERCWKAICLRIYRIYRFKPLAIWLSVILILVFSIFSSFRIDRNNFILSSMPVNHSLTTDVEFFESKLGGARSFDFAVIPLKDSTVNNPAILEEIKRVDNYLESRSDFGAVLSTATLYESLFAVIHPAKEMKLPGNDIEIKQVENVISRQNQLFSLTLIDSSRTTGRITGRMKDLGRIESGKVIEEINNWINENTDTTLVKFITTGSMHIMDKVQQCTLRNMITGLLVAITVISILMAILFRNFLLVLITMLSNLIPIVALAGLLPVLNLGLRYNTSIVFAIGFAIAIDNTIHFIGNYRLYSKKNYTVSSSIFLTLRYTGKAILITALILFLSFFSLLFSEFKDSYSIGAMLSSMIILALLVDLFVVPLMLDNWLGRKNRKIITGE